MKSKGCFSGAKTNLVIYKFYKHVQKEFINSIFSGQLSGNLQIVVNGVIVGNYSWNGTVDDEGFLSYTLEIFDL